MIDRLWAYARRVRDAMAQQEGEGGFYRALPLVDRDVLDFVLEDDAGPVRRFGAAFSVIGDALASVDEEMGQLSEANPNLAAAVRGTVEGLYAAVAGVVPSEQAKAILRTATYFNAFVLLRLLDMQWRRKQQGA